MARFYLWMIQELGLEGVTLVGHFLGGWIAAEMATMSPGSLGSLVLVDAAGVRPRKVRSPTSSCWARKRQRNSPSTMRRVFRGTPKPVRTRVES